MVFKSKILILTAFVLFLDLAVLVVLLMSGGTSLGIFLMFSTFAILGSGFIWLIAREDEEVHLMGPGRVFPMLLWGVAMIMAFERSKIKIVEVPESLNEVGQMMGSRNLVAVGIVSVAVLSVFITLVSIFSRGQQR